MEKQIPNNLKTAYVTPLLKKDDPDNPENYRPISVTSSLSKIFERLLQKLIVVLNERCYSETQFGFRNNYSTIDALLYCTESCRLAVDNNKIITAAHLDLSKTFDSIKHNILEERLVFMNFSENAADLLINFVTDRRQQTIVNNATSNLIG